MNERYFKLKNSQYTNSLYYILFIILLVSSELSAREKSYKWLNQGNAADILQKRKFEKKGRFYIDIGGGSSFAGQYVKGPLLSGRVGGFFSEELGVEFVYSKLKLKESSTAQNLKNSTAVPFYYNVKDYVGVMSMWAPLYSKLNFADYLFYSDVFFGLGVGRLSTTDNGPGIDSLSTRQSFYESKRTVGLINIGSRFYITKYINLRLDYMGVVFQGRKGEVGETLNGEDLKLHHDVTFSLGFMF
ncbi:outer membrane beta-barrel domain-containing protein [Bacteriovoracaceae bacterium]|nr:outer membrane beta-barrel domain-containing protein [Bacteriovoracaceae bacterium]